MATITITLAYSVSYCYWTMSNGRSGTLYAGQTESWTRLSSSDYLTLYPAPASGYVNPIRFTRTDGYIQTVVRSDGSAGDRVVSFSQDKTGTLTATRESPKYTITYNGNNATGGSTASQTGGTTYTIRACGFYKTGYTFQYWRTASGTRYNPGQSVTLSSNLSLYAYWETTKYTISYNANGGSGAPDSQTKYYGTDLTLSNTKPTWAGHNFIGWSTNSARDASVEYRAGGTYSTEASATLYAVWDCTVSLYSHGSLYTSLYARIGKKVTLPFMSDTETEEFQGWQLGDTIYAAGTDLSVSTNMTLYAVWKDITFKITYRGNNETGGSTEEQTGALTYEIRKCGFYKTGYIFQYWRTASGTKYYPGDSITPKNDMTLYAYWKAKRYFYWHGSDGSDSQYFAAGERIDLALTAGAWNNLCDFVNEARSDAGMTTIAFASVSVGDSISAVKYNIVSNAIKQIVNSGYGKITPQTVSAGQEIVTSLFNGGSSLKAAINSVVDDLK